MTGFVQQQDDAEGVVVPHGELSADALRGLAEAFVLREGTEYGEHAYSLEQKVRHVVGQLERGEAIIVCEPTSGRVDIVLKQSVQQKAR